MTSVPGGSSSARATWPWYPNVLVGSVSVHWLRSTGGEGVAVPGAAGEGVALGPAATEADGDGSGRSD